MAHDKKLVIYTEHFVPYSYQNEEGEYVGINIDISKKLCELAAIECEFVLLPWKRAYNLVQTNAFSAIVSLARTDDREPMFQWVGPLVSNQTYFYKLKTNDHVVMNTISEAKNYSLGIVRGDIYESLVSDIGFVNNKNLLTFGDKDTYLRLFFSQRIDLIIGSDFTIGHTTKLFGFSPDDLVRLAQLHENVIAGNYLGFNKAASPEVIARFNQAYNTLKALSGFEPYIKRYVASNSVALDTVGSSSTAK